MNVVGQFFGDPEPNSRAFLRLCQCWAQDALTSFLEKYQPAGQLRPFNDAVLAEIERDLSERISRAQEEPNRNQNSWCRTLGGRLSNGFLAGDEIEPLLSEAVNTFVAALMAFHLLRMAGEKEHKEWAAEVLLNSLREPILRSLYTNFDKKKADRVIDDVLCSVEDQIESWVEQPPEEFGQAVAWARKLGSWRAVNVSERHQREETTFDPTESWVQALAAKIDNVPKDDLEWWIRESLYGLLAGIYEPSCIMAGRLPNDEGQRLFLWLVLGGVNSVATTRSRQRKVDYLDQKMLIEAMKQRFKENTFVRKLYERPLSKHLPDVAASFTVAGRDGLLKQMQSAGCPSQILKQFERFFAKKADYIERLALLARLTGHGAEKARRIPKLAKFFESETLVEAPALLIWALFRAAGYFTFHEIAEGHLAERDEHATALETAEHALGSVRAFVCRPCGNDQLPERAFVAGMAQYLCSRATGVDYWTGLFPKRGTGNAFG